MRWLAIVIALVGVASAAPKQAKKHEHGTLVLMIDRSGSMHVGGNEAATTALRAVIAELDPSDDVAVIAFDAAPSVIVRRQKASNVDLHDLDRLQFGGATDFVPALKLARKMFDGVAGKKHIVMISDGDAPSDGLAPVLDELRAAHVTISAINLGDQEESRLLATIVTKGNGTQYTIDALDNLPKIIARDVAAFVPR